MCLAFLIHSHSQQLEQKPFAYNAINPHLLVSGGLPKDSIQMGAQQKNF